MMSTGGFGNEIEAYGGFFDRISNTVSGMPRDTYDYAELQDCRTHLRLCAARIQELESINVDLEARLEAQANEYIKLETDTAESQARWKTQYEALENECEMWRQSNAQLELKNHKLRDQLIRTERELHGILQKKYDFMELARQEERDRIRAEQAMAADNDQQPRGTPAPRSPAMQLYEASVLKHDERTMLRAPSPAPSFARNHNPHALEPADIRRGRAILALCDFFGLSNRPNAEPGAAPY
ncbi:hypothetical protein CTAYLR_007378 [Chrysophaeum taylorii]|uniref:Uncharacterized protein n=1 Tax=Chrysophaeum taylorii TaxID=2483200 RepID=A0AAD7XEG3_9STRA|nr:hypothetical protein CTAYLR_007378 [Chrysophaeum taylorii]